MKVLPILGLLALLAVPAQAAAPQAPVSASAEPLSGKWKFRGRLGRLYLRTTCDFKQEGRVLTGSCRDNASAGAPKVLTHGTVGRDWVRFSYETGFAGERFQAHYFGKLTDGIINEGWVRNYELGGRMIGYRAG